MHTAYVSVRMGLLTLLDRADAYGYALRAGFEAATGSLWPLNIGQVYSTLDRLERDGLVTADDRGEGEGQSQRWYAITSAGRDELHAWFDAAEVDEAPPRDGLQARVLLALVAGPEAALEVVTRQRTALTGVLQQRRRRARRTPAEGDAERLAAELVDEAVIARAESALRWLDTCEERLLATIPTTARRIR